MKINTKEVKRLIKEQFRNNQTWFAEEIGINTHYLNRILNGYEKATSPKAIQKIIAYCQRNNLDYKEFIILP